MQDLNAILNDAVANNQVPFVIAMTGNSSEVTWSGTAGNRTADAPATMDTVFRIFSMTKAVGSVAAMILVDRGKLDFDTPVVDILPEFADVKVLDGFDGDTPQLRAPKTTATVRHLATHTSGLVYEFWNPDIPKYMELTGHPTILSGLKSSLFYPMAFDPGERWDYGIGIDWLSQVIEKVDGRTIDVFCREEIFGPLGMSDTDFEVRDDFAPRLADARIRGEDGQFGPFEIAPPPNPEFYGMGHALYSTAPNYMRFTRMVLNNGELDGNRILSEEGVAKMTANHTGDVRVGMLKTVAPPLTADAEFFPGTHKTHSFAFMRNEEDIPGMRAAGSQAWAGVLNTHYWIDHTNDVTAVLMTQSLPFVEPPYMQLYETFEKAVYANLG